MPPFVESMFQWARLTAGHLLLMFWWIWLPAVMLTALSESYWIEGRRRRLLARGVSRAGVLAYLVSAQSMLIWMLFFIVELDGPQPMIGQLVAVAGTPRWSRSRRWRRWRRT